MRLITPCLLGTSLIMEAFKRQDPYIDVVPPYVRRRLSRSAPLRFKGKLAKS